MSKKVIIADDEGRMRKLVKDFLKRNEYEVIEAENGKVCVEAFSANPDTDVVILDIMMPVMNGYEALSEIRKTSDVPVVMLTAKSAEEDELMGFSQGADEYITKPFSPKILVARVEALLRRKAVSDIKLQQDNNRLTAGAIVVDVDAHEVYVGDELLKLSVKEFELLKYFMENKGLALSREQILSAVWEYDYYGDARTIDTHVKMLRSKLKEYGKYIKTIWGMGYKFEEDR